MLFAGVLLSSSSAGAQSFGQFTAAPPIEMNGHMAGAYLESSSNVLGLLGQLRLSFYPGVDFGFQGGFARQDYGTDSRTTLRLGTDFKYAVRNPSTADPYAISIGGALGVETGDHFNILSIGPTIVGSRALSGGRTLVVTPFVGAVAQFTRINVGDLDTTDFSIPLRLGANIHVNQQLDLVGELQFRIGDTFNDDVGFALGANFPF
jgi:hypothetical protein